MSSSRVMPRKLAAVGAVAAAAMATASPALAATYAGGPDLRAGRGHLPHHRARAAGHRARRLPGAAALRQPPGRLGPEPAGGRSRVAYRGSTRLNACAGIGFTVLHNDHAGSAYLPAGAYTVSSRNLDCGTASADFTSFLAGAGKTIPGWNTTSPAAGRATFNQRNSGLSFSVAKRG